jgi:hypothetical protein
MTAITSKTFTTAPFPTFPHATALLDGFTDFVVRPLSRLFNLLRDQHGAGFGDAEALRRYARQFERTDPGFASDLYAAAARYESKLD